MLAKGTVSGQEVASTTVTMKFADHQKYATCINYAVHSANIIVNEKEYSRLGACRNRPARHRGRAMAYERTKVSNACRGRQTLQEQGMELLGVVEDLRVDPPRAASWLKCYDVLRVATPTRARRSWRWCFPRRKHWPTRGRTGSGSRLRR